MVKCVVNVLHQSVWPGLMQLLQNIGSVIYTAGTETKKIFRNLQKLWSAERLQPRHGALHQPAALFKENTSCHVIILKNLCGILEQWRKNRGERLNKLCEPVFFTIQPASRHRHNYHLLK